MNENMGIVGRKMGCTQVFLEDGRVERVTVIEVGPCTVIRLRTPEKDGYSALVLGFGDRSEKNLRKPDLGPYEIEDGELKKAGIRPRKLLREVRLPKQAVEAFSVGQTISAGDVFAAGQFVDVIGTTKGRGFAGVFKRHGFKGASNTYGTHEYFRHGGSIGQNMTPGHTFKGLRMPGHYGHARMTSQSLRVIDVKADTGLILVRGAVPGPTNGVVMVRHASKKPAPARS